MIKLIASDIDGTLLPEGTNKFNPELFKTILKLKEKGIYFVAASGRSFASMLHIFKEIQNDIIFISGNGGYIHCKGYDVLEITLEQEVLLELLEDLRLIPQISIVADTKKEVFIENNNDELKHLLEIGYGNQVSIVNDISEIGNKIIKISIYNKNGIEDLTYLIPQWESKLHGTISGKTWIDFMHPTTNKGYALKNIQKSLGISPEETMAFGDNCNDLEMLANATESYAVGNAREEVKQAAKYITDTNVNDGVLKVLKTLL